MEVTEIKMGLLYQAVIVALVSLSTATLWPCYGPNISGITAVTEAAVPVKAYPMSAPKPGTLGFWKTMSRQQQGEMVVAMTHSMLGDRYTPHRAIDLLICMDEAAKDRASHHLRLYEAGRSCAVLMGW